MKTCPICGARAFDDAETCFGCLHRFVDEEPAAPAAPEFAPAAPRVRRQPTMLAPEVSAAPAAPESAPAPSASQEPWPDPAPDPEPSPVPAASASQAAPAPDEPDASEPDGPEFEGPGPDDPGFYDELVYDGFNGEDFQPCISVPMRPDANLPSNALSLSLPLAGDVRDGGWTLCLEWPRAGQSPSSSPEELASSGRGFVLSLQPARPAAPRGSHARVAEPVPAAPPDGRA